MFSRRTILAWLGLAPVAIAVAKAVPSQAMAGDVVAAAPRVRSRTWKHVLEPDGSSAFVKNGERWLDSWVKTQKEEDRPTGGVFDIKTIIQNDAEALKVRCDHWRDFRTFQPVFGDIYEGEVPENNPYKRGLLRDKDGSIKIGWGGVIGERARELFPEYWDFKRV